jgi:hypothetical protein
MGGDGVLYCEIESVKPGSGVWDHISRGIDMHALQGVFSHPFYDARFGGFIIVLA